MYKWRRLAELGIIGMPGASELPSFVAVEITKDVRSLPASVREGEPAAISGARRRRRRKIAGLSIGTQLGPRIGMEKGPLTGVGAGLSR